MFRPPPKRIYDWEDPIVAPGSDAHSFPLPGPPADAKLGRRGAVPAPRGALPIFVVPELPELAVPEFLASPRPARPHPHRRRMRWERARRPGSIPRPPVHCLSPVRRSRAARARDELAP